MRFLGSQGQDNPELKLGSAHKEGGLGAEEEVSMPLPLRREPGKWGRGRRRGSGKAGAGGEARPFSVDRGGARPQAQVCVLGPEGLWHRVREEEGASWAVWWQDGRLVGQEGLQSPSGHLRTETCKDLLENRLPLCVPPEWGPGTDSRAGKTEGRPRCCTPRRKGGGA